MRKVVLETLILIGHIGSKMNRGKEQSTQRTCVNRRGTGCGNLSEGRKTAESQKE